MSETLKRLQSSVDLFDLKMHEVPSSAWSAPTPCSEWDVHDLVGHVVNELCWVPPLLLGRTIADVGDSLDGDLLGSDPLGSWHHASADATTAFSLPDAMGSTVHLSYGDERVENYCDQLTLDLVIHSWDLAKGAGLDATLPSDLVTWSDGFVRSMLEMLRGSGLFGQDLAVPAGADAQTQLLGLLGRDATS
jgi:uncharacterized protein (TIGR03086 family)